MAEGDAASITEDLKRMLNVSSTSNDPSSPSKTETSPVTQDSSVPPQSKSHKNKNEKRKKQKGDLKIKVEKFLDKVAAAESVATNDTDKPNEVSPSQTETTSNSPAPQHAKNKKRNRNKKPKNDDTKNVGGVDAAAALTVETLENGGRNITNKPLTEVMGSLSISVDQQGRRTSSERQSGDTSTVKEKHTVSQPKRKNSEPKSPKEKEKIKLNPSPTSATNEKKKTHSATKQRKSPEPIEKPNESQLNKNKNSNAANKPSNKGKKPDVKDSNIKPLVNKEAEGDNKFEKSLEKNWIFPLRKKSTKFPRACFFCRICSYHLDLKEDCNRHMGEKRHQRRKEVTETENILRFIPKPTQKQLESLNTLLDDIYQQHALTEVDTEKRHTIIKLLEEKLRLLIPDVVLKMYGSSLSGFGLKSSNVNIYVHSPSAKSMPKVLVMIYDFMKKNEDIFRNVKSDFYSKVPSVYYEDPNTGIHCYLSINSCFARDTSRLLSIYSNIDIRVKQLGIIFRTWAKICGLDRQKEGTLPAYSLSLMTVYYLQNTSPPVLPTFYKDFPKFAECESVKDDWFSTITKEAAEWKGVNKESIAELWLGILKVYSLTFDTTNDVVSIKLENIPRTEKKWNSKKLAVEDPFAPKLNVARTVSNAMIYEYLQDTLRKAYNYFGLPRNEAGDSWIPLKSLENLAAAFAVEDYKKKDKLSFSSVNDHEASPDVNLEDAIQDSALGENSENQNKTPTSSTTDLSNSNNSTIPCDTKSKDSKDNLLTFARNFAVLVIDNALEEYKSGLVSDEKSSSDIKITDYIDLDVLQDKQCFYYFTEQVLSDGKGLPVICSFCEGEGHLKDNCPDDVLPKIQPLPTMTTQHLQVLSKTLHNVIYDFAPTPQEKNDRKRILKDVEIFIQKNVYPDACLQPFGSSCNGFGFSKSDLDICLTFKERLQESLDFVEVIKNLAVKLEKHDGLRSITAITTAKVPIVKFRHRQSGLEGDISLYNTLAQHNTKLLETYSCIDERVVVLGYAFKVFAKICDIGDASKGSLSSYAYVLMLLHYLQQCQPPVIPVLQELYKEGSDKPEILVEEWNVWFYNDLQSLPEVWPDYQKNTQSIGELWMGLFQYYSLFPIKDHVINIRQKGPLTRFEKLWNGECLAIEDPFDLNHNLGGGLSKKMNNYILHAVINARALYGTPFETVPQLVEKYMTPADYFFDPLLISDGRPPNDRGCRECGKIGHIAKKCPQHLKNVQKRKERDQKFKEQRQQQKQHQQGQQHHYQQQGNHHQQQGNHHQQHQGNHPGLQGYSPRSPGNYSQHQPGPGTYIDRNGLRNSPTREQRRRNNSYNEPQQPLLPLPGQRQRNDSHPGTRNGPTPLMSVKVDNSPLLPMPNYHQVQGTSLAPHFTIVNTTSGCRVLLPPQYCQTISTPPIQPLLVSPLPPQPGPNGGPSYYNNKPTIPPSRHKPMYAPGPRNPVGGRPL